MAHEAEVIVQLPHGSSVDTHLREDTPAAVADGRVVLEHLPAGEDGRLLPPEAGEILLTVPSPESLRRDQAEVERVLRSAAADGGPLVVLVDVAEYLRDDELGAVLDAAGSTRRTVILRIMAGA
ncbi:MAG TPA: hypothetical protein VFV41_29220 [Streptosporangiaceae bacterium]|nr:hypothetical protein [Streptosporangiaceae bacterium]